MDSDDPKLDVIYCIDKGCAKELLLDGYNCVLGYDVKGFPEHLINTMIAGGLIFVDTSGWVQVTSAGWEFWKLKE